MLLLFVFKLFLLFFLCVFSEHFSFFLCDFLWYTVMGRKHRQTIMKINHVLSIARIMAHHCLLLCTIASIFFNELYIYLVSSNIILVVSTVFKLYLKAIKLMYI